MPWFFTLDTKAYLNYTKDVKSQNSKSKMCPMLHIVNVCTIRQTQKNSMETRWVFCSFSGFLFFQEKTYRLTMQNQWTKPINRRIYSASAYWLQDLVHNSKTPSFSPCPDGGTNQSQLNNQKSMILPIADPLLVVESSASLQGLAALSIGIFSSHAKASSRYLTVKKGEKESWGV